MTNKVLLRTAFIAAVLAPATVALADDPKNPPAVTDKTKPAVSDADVAILAHFRHVNVMEIDMGKVAQAQSTNKKVKAYGKTLVTDHTKGLKAADKFIKANKLTVPEDKAKDAAEEAEMKATMEAMEKMKTLKGADFDAAFLPAMADGHTKELAKLDAALTTVTDAKLKAILEAARPAMQKHADDAKAMVDASKTTSTAPTAPAPTPTK